MSPVQNPIAPRRILVAVDGSADSERAAKYAILTAKSNRSTLILLHVKELPVELVGGEVSAESKPAEQEQEGNAEKVVDDLLTLAEREGVEARKVIMEREKSVLQSILDYADKERIDLIVVGTRGLRGVKKMLLGSVASGLSTSARCSVLIVR
jgi:nucleotide-binding universal stress UspA family protein